MLQLRESWGILKSQPKVFRNSKDGAPTIVINGIIKVAFLLMGLPGVISPLYIYRVLKGGVSKGRG